MMGEKLEYDELLEKKDKTPEDLLKITAYEKKVPQKYIEEYAGYYSLSKPDNWERQTGTDLWYEDDWWMQEHKDFYREVYLNPDYWDKPHERKDYRTVPT